jgi:hypothetical protein
MKTSEIFTPISLDEVADAFISKTVLFRKGPSDRFRALFSMERLEQVLDAQRRSRSGSGSLSVRASFDHWHSLLTIAPNYAIRLYKAGATLCISELCIADQLLHDVALRARRDLRFLGTTDFRCYLSPHGDGFDTHFDMRISTTLQIEGRKRWRYSNEPALDWPHYQIFPGQLAPSEGPSKSVTNTQTYRDPSTCTFTEVELEPGDVLCLPAGIWHSARAVGHSLALNLAFEPQRHFWDFLGPMVLPSLMAESVWRQPPPVGVDRTATLPSSIKEYFDGRVDRLIAILNQLKKDDAALHRRWTELLDRPNNTQPNMVTVRPHQTYQRRVDRLRNGLDAMQAYYTALRAARSARGVHPRRD